MARGRGVVPAAHTWAVIGCRNKSRRLGGGWGTQPAASGQGGVRGRVRTRDGPHLPGPALQGDRGLKGCPPVYEQLGAPGQLAQRVRRFGRLGACLGDAVLDQDALDVAFGQGGDRDKRVDAQAARDEGAVIDVEPIVAFHAAVQVGGFAEYHTAQWVVC